MRHALLTELWYPVIGGSIQLFDSVYRQHLPPGDRCHVIAGGAPGDFAVDVSYALPVTRFDNTRYPWMRPESALEYARMVVATAAVCVRERVEVLHCARVIPEGIVAYGVRRMLGVPYVVWVHGEEVSVFLRYGVKKRVMPLVFGAARGVIANSSFTRGRALAAGAPAERLHRVNPGVDAEAFVGPWDTRDLATRWDTLGKRVVLTVGRLCRRKGHDIVLRALAALRLPDVVYLVVSEGELESELKALARELGIEDSVRWVGPVRWTDLPRYYALADVFVMANRTLDDDDVEGFGMVFLEASASGVPVIGGRSGGVTDAVADGVSGLLVDGASVPAVAEALRSLLDDPGRRARMGAAGRAWARRFSWETAAARVRAIAAGDSVTTPQG